MTKLSPALDRIPPQALDAEQAVLGSLMIAADQDAAKVVRELLTASDFYQGGHRAIFGAICRLNDREQPTDMLTVAHELTEAGLYDQAGGREYLLACHDSVPHSLRAPAYARMVLKASMQRRIMDRFGQLVGRAQEREDPSEILLSAEREIGTIRTRAEGGENDDTGITAAELMRKQLPPPRWAVPDLLPQGMTILGGKPKTKKSFLTIQLGIAIASAGIALSKIEVEQGPVLCLALEDTERRLQDRLTMLLGGAPAPNDLHLFTRWPGLSDGGRIRLVRWIRKHPNVRLVVIDTLEKVRPARDARQGVYAEDYGAIGMIKEVADDYGASILVVHHLNKLPGVADPLDMLSGSTGIGGAADGAIILRGARGSADATLTVMGRDVKDAELAIRWDDHAGWGLMGDAAAYARTQAQQRIISVLVEAKKAMKPHEVAAELEADRNTVKQQMYRMELAKILLKDFSGNYLPASAAVEQSRNGAEQPDPFEPVAK